MKGKATVKPTAPTRPPAPASSTAFLVRKQVEVSRGSIPGSPDHHRPEHTSKKFWQTSSYGFVRLGSLPALKKDALTRRGTPTELSEDVKFPEKFGEMYLTEPMQKEIKDLENWAFQNVARKQFAPTAGGTDSPEQLIEKLLKEARPYTLPDLDLRMIDLLMRESKVERRFRDMAEKEAAGMASKKIAVTSETINREYNKTLMLGLIRRKLLENPSCREFNENYLYMIAKTILMDFVSSFQVLEVFKHQNVLQVKTLLAGAKEPLTKALAGTLAPVVQTPTSRVRGFVAYERVLLEAHENIVLKIRQKKVDVEAEQNRLKILKTEIDTRTEDLQALVREKDTKENQSVFMRKFGQAIGIQEFVAINELKKRIETEEQKLEELRRQVSSSKEESQGRAGQLQEEIRTLKLRKTVFSIKLREFYLNVLREEEDLLILGKSLVDVLTSLFRFAPDLKPSLFSPFYSQADIHFALGHARLKKQAAEIKLDNRGNQALLKRLHGLLYSRLEREAGAANFDGLKRTIQVMKKSNLRIFERKTIKRSKSVIMKWETLKDGPSGVLANPFLLPTADKAFPMNEETRGLACIANSKRVNQISQQMAKDKVRYLKSVFTRFAQLRTGGLSGLNAELKKLLTLVFGPGEAQAILNRFKERGWAAFEEAPAVESEEDSEAD